MVEQMNEDEEQVPLEQVSTGMNKRIDRRTSIWMNEFTDGRRNGKQEGK